MSDYLDQIEARIEAATEGPWSVYTTRGGTYVTRPDLLGVAREWSLVWQDGDAEFIAHAREDLPRLLAAVRAVEALHCRETVQAITGDCATEECDHEDECPTIPVDVCAECYRVSEEADAYFHERNIAPAAYPCPTIRAITEALEGER